MTLLDLLTVMSFVTPISGAFGAVKHHHLGISGYMLTALLGLALGILSAWCLRASAMALAPRFETMKKPLQLACTAAYVCACIVWPFFGMFAGAWAAKPIVGWAS